MEIQHNGFTIKISFKSQYHEKENYTFGYGSRNGFAFR